MTTMTMTTTATRGTTAETTTEPADRRRWLLLGRPFRSLRGRILVRFVLALGIATVVSVIFQRQGLMAQLDQRIDADLTQEVTELRRLVGGRDDQGRCLGGTVGGRCEVGRDPLTGEPFGGDVEAVFDTFLRRNIPTDYELMITFVGGRPYKVPATRPDFAAAADDSLFHLATVATPERGDVDSPHGSLRYLAVPVVGATADQTGVFVVGQFRDLQRDQVDDGLGVVAAVDFMLLLVASVLAYYAAGRVLAPVRKVRETARQISETDLSRRIEVTGDDEIAELSATFNQMLDRLQKSFVTQRNFVDDAGHELRTPITIIRGHIELLGNNPQEREETVAIVIDELDRMNRMVDDLLVLARAERLDFLRLEAVEVETLTDDLLSKASALGRREWGVEQAGRGRIIADPQRLTQAVMQLADNATQHTADGDRIILGSVVAAGEARFWVSDDGPGIPPEDQERIFDRFSRGSLARRTEGSGLGLSIVRAIAEAHGGHVELRSRPGAGATFTIVVPTEGPAEAGGPHP